MFPWQLQMGTLGRALASPVQIGSSSLLLCCCDKTLTKTKWGKKRVSRSLFSLEGTRGRNWRQELKQNVGEMILTGLPLASVS